MGETRVNLLRILEDLRDAYPGTIEETIVTEVVANALDSGARDVSIHTDPAAAAMTVSDDGKGMGKQALSRYQDTRSCSRPSCDPAPRGPALPASSSPPRPAGCTPR